MYATFRRFEWILAAIPSREAASSHCRLLVIHLHRGFHGIDQNIVVGLLLLVSSFGHTFLFGVRMVLVVCIRMSALVPFILLSLTA